METAHPMIQRQALRVIEGEEQVPAADVSCAALISIARQTQSLKEEAITRASYLRVSAMK